MVAHVKVGGAWRTLTPNFKVGGVWRTATGGWVKVAGVWRQFYPTTTSTHSMTTGTQASPPLSGYVSGLMGALSPTTGPIPGSTILQMYADINGGTVGLVLTGTHANAGWADFVVAGLYTYARTAATFNQTGGNTTWVWSSSNPFGGNPSIVFHG